MSMLLSGGPVLFIFILVMVAISIYALYVFFDRLWQLSRERLDGDRLMDSVNAAIDSRDVDAALAVCDEHGGPIGRVLEYALTRLPFGRTAVEAAFQEASIEEEQRLTKGLRSLATIAQIAPLLGLLGTVLGMIVAFNNFSSQGVNSVQSVGTGISTALVTTAAGLIIAIPALIGYNFLSGKVELILSEIDRRREEFMGRVAQVVSARKTTSTSVTSTGHDDLLGDRHEPIRPPR